MSNFINNMLEQFDTFTNSQRRIANYLTEHIDNVAFITLEELANTIGVSTTTIIRFSRTLGYQGYTEMQKDIQGDIKSKVSLPERIINKSSVSTDQLIVESFKNDIANIEKTLANLSDNILNDTINAISAAEHIYILGVRSSFALAHYMYTRIGQVKRNVRLIQSIGVTYPEELLGITENDVCIAYFFPRYSKTTASILSWLKRKGVKNILFTGMSYQAIENFGDIFLPCAVSSISIKNSYAAPLCLTNYIAAAVTNTDLNQAHETLEDIENILNVGFYLGL